MIDIIWRKKITEQEDNSGFALYPSAFRMEYAAENKVAYHFFRKGVRYEEPDKKFFTETSQLAKTLLGGLEGCVFYGSLAAEQVPASFRAAQMITLAYPGIKEVVVPLAEATLSESAKEYVFLLEDICQLKNNAPISDGFFADYYAIDQLFPEAGTSYNRIKEQLKRTARLAIISDDTHAVWTILRDKEYSHSMLLERLNKFCGFYSAELHWYENS